MNSLVFLKLFYKTIKKLGKVLLCTNGLQVLLLTESPHMLLPLCSGSVAVV